MARGQFSKITEIACLSGREFGADNSPHGVYVTRHWNWMNSYWILWIGRLRRVRWEFAQWVVSVIFEKLHSVIKPYFLLFEARISCVFLIFLLRSIKAYLCPNMINVDAVDFSERRPEEVISLFWRSVYMRASEASELRKCCKFLHNKSAISFNMDGEEQPFTNKHLKAYLKNA